MGISFNADEIFEMGMDVEKNGEAYYRKCAELSGDPGIRKVFAWLAGERGSHSAILCGRNAVQLSFPDRTVLSLDALAARLQGLGQVSVNAYLLRLKVDPYQITVFPDGRAIVTGTEEIAEAKTLYARYIGT